MIPILYNASLADATTISNGLGRLQDCISCKVTEERNGEYTLELEYPLNGINASKLATQRIIKALAGEKTGLQCFRIVRMSPNMKTVKVYANHISYDLSYYPVNTFTITPGPNTYLPSYFAAIWSNQVLTNPFSFSVESILPVPIPTSWGTSVPVSTMAMFGGSGDSILKLVGGEFEWDNRIVKWSRERGTDAGVSIRYGKNLMSFDQEANIAETVCGILPYWTGSGNTVVGDVQYSSNASSFPFGKTKVVDFSGSLSSPPTVDVLNVAAGIYITQNNVGVPEVSTDIALFPLWQTPEYAKFADLEKVGLCDTVSVFFPTLNVQTKAKVVKTVFNVLLERYESITLGTIKKNLADTIAALM